MTEPISTPVATPPDRPQRRSPLLLIGCVLWVLCLIGICFCWYQWREKVLSQREGPVGNHG